ncbi:MAG: hypothetical protein Q8L22_05955 [Reyranella sp.]|nr:hypothetical protein [Reyranella sp.]
MSSRFHPEVPALAPTVAKAVRLVRAVLCLALIVAVVIILRSAAYEHFHGSDALLKAVMSLFGS